MEEKNTNAGTLLAEMESIGEELKHLKEYADLKSLSDDEKRLIKDVLLTMESKSHNLIVNIKTRLSVPGSLMSLRDSLLKEGDKHSVEIDIATAESIKRQVEFGLAIDAMNKTNKNTDPVGYYCALADLSEAKCKLTMSLHECTLQVYREKIAELESSHEICQPKLSKTTNATIGNLKKRIQELTEGYEGASKLAYEIGRRGQKNGNPWSEAEILDLAEELGVSIKGDCLRAFKAGMPADLVKKDAGARPITPREESPDDVES